jgi:hypothetical protein
MEVETVETSSSLELQLQKEPSEASECRVAQARDGEASQTVEAIRQHDVLLHSEARDSWFS